MDTWVQTGTTVTPHYDSLIAKLMVYADSRPAAIAKLQAALAETKVTYALRICHDWRLCLMWVTPCRVGHPLLHTLAARPMHSLETADGPAVCIS